MTKQGISTGTSPNSGTGDTLLNAGVKINSNFDDIYDSLGDGSSLSDILIGNNVPTGTASQPLQVSGGAYVSGNLGIGTTNPIDELHLQGIFRVDRGLAAQDQSYIRYFRQGTEKARFGLLASDNAIFFNATANDSANHLVINSSGNVLIGAATPTGTSSQPLQVSGGAYVSGNLGIGTISPVKKLHLQTSFVSGEARGGSFTQALFESNNATSSFWEFQANSSTTNDILFSKSNTGSYGSVGYDHSTDALRFYTNSAERVRIDSNGFTTHIGAIGRGAPVTKTSSFTLGIAENWIICNGTAIITATLPTASAWTGREIMIKTIAAFTVVSASSNVVPLAGGAAGTAILAATAGKFATLVSDGTNWIIMQAN
jgi:hypothetical protein